MNRNQAQDAKINLGDWWWPKQTGGVIRAELGEVVDAFRGRQRTNLLIKYSVT